VRSKGCVLVTGGAGFIGSHTCKHLSAQGFYPVAYDNLSTGHRRAVRWGPLLEGDVLDATKLTAAMLHYAPVAVFHFAASAYVGESVEDPAKYYYNNVGGMISLLGALRTIPIRYLVFSSSCATYGIPELLPIDEQSIQKPINPYGRSKLICEQMMTDHANAYGLTFAILRYFNACGADPDGELGEWHSPETHLIPLALLAASGRLPPLAIFGDDYDTPDGTCVRDFVHVSDLARAHVLALDHLVGGGASLAVNLGTGRGMSIRQILDGIQRTTHRRVPTVVKLRRRGDPPILYASVDLARTTLGFEPMLSDIGTIVQTAAPFFGLEAYQ
jgi:UDP-arabinose 4-epimerase